MASPMQKRKLMGEINVVPYIDVMLVLLIIFMVTAPLLTPGIEVELPKAGAGALDDADNLPLVVSVDQTGNLYINVGDAEEEPASADDIVQRTRIVLTNRPEPRQSSSKRIVASSTASSWAPWFCCSGPAPRTWAS